MALEQERKNCRRTLQRQEQYRGTSMQVSSRLANWLSPRLGQGCVLIDLPNATQSKFHVHGCKLKPVPYQFSNLLVQLHVYSVIMQALMRFPSILGHQKSVTCVLAQVVEQMGLRNQNWDSTSKRTIGRNHSPRESSLLTG